jgi:hypothetical protein
MARGQSIFLSDLQNLLSFNIIDLKINDIKPIHFLHNLKELGITTYCSTEINFSAFHQIECCNLEWGKRKVRSLFERKLKSLYVNRYNGSDTNDFMNLKELESLSILNSPIKCLRGLSALQNIKSLRLAMLTKLTSLAGIEKLENLEQLDINTCKQIMTIDEVKYMNKLRTICINNSGDIASLKPLNKLNCLESIIFYESTNIVDGDLTPLIRTPPLSTISFQNRRHYSHSREKLIQ